MRKIFGLPYKGSKSKLAERILGVFPKAEHLYDLFCGGSAIAHCAMIKVQYKHVHINDINPMMPMAFVQAVNGEFGDETRWISREDFFRLKDSDPYAAICFSFGNDLKTYCYGRNIEETKKALHYAIFFGSYELSDRLIGVDLCPIEKCATRQEKYSMVKRLIKEAYSRNTPPVQLSRCLANGSDGCRLQNMEQLERCQMLLLQKTRCVPICRTSKVSTASQASEYGKTQQNSNIYPPRIQEVEHGNQERSLRIDGISSSDKSCLLTWSSEDYQDVKIEDNSVIYCDIPYQSTSKYVGRGEDFDYGRFYEWCQRQTQPLFISSYEMPESDFKVVAEFKRIDTLSATNNNKIVTERLFVPRTQVKDSWVVHDNPRTK